MPPLLSICIPTYNRADLLYDLLRCLSLEIAPYCDDVELIVSDNCSTDHTANIIQEMSQRVKIQYNRNSNNLGFASNVKILVEQLATGEFCLIVGDDDLVRRGMVEKVLKTIKAHPEIDYIFMNLNFVHIQKRAAALQRITEFVDISEIHDAMCQRQDDTLIACGEDIISFTDMAGVFGPMPSNIFRRSRWNKVQLDPYRSSDFQLFESAFPHIAGIAHMIVSKPCFYIGYPYIAFSSMTQEWFDYWWPSVFLGPVLAISDLFKKLGAKKEMVDRYRTLVFKYVPASYYFWMLLLKKKHVNYDTFSFLSLVKRYYMYPEFWAMITRPLLMKIKFYYKKLMKLPWFIARKLYARHKPCGE